MSELTVQLHYNFYDINSHLLDYYTRKTCSDSQVRILETIIGILYPGAKYQVLSMPDQGGSFKDNTVVKFLNDNEGSIVAVATVVGLVFAAILFNGQLGNNKTSTQINTLEIAQKCRELGLDETQISLLENEICTSYGIKLDKNNFYESVNADSHVSEIHPKVISNSEETLFDDKILRANFNLYIEETPKLKEFTQTGQYGHIELAQPFLLKQQRYGRGAAWKGVYYGEDIIDNEDDTVVLQDGENVFFYMQDSEYKEQILSQEITFKSGDNIGIFFDIGRYFNYFNKTYSNPRLYVTKVVSHNDNLIQHKEELKLRTKLKIHDEQDKKQQRLFD